MSCSEENTGVDDIIFDSAIAKSPLNTGCGYGIPNSETIKKLYLENIERSTKFLDEYTKMRISAIKSFDSYMHVMMESYSKYLSQFNKSKN